MLTHECKGNASYKHLSIKQENIDLYYKNKSRIFATVPKKDNTYEIKNYLPFIVKNKGKWSVDDPQFPFHLVFEEEGMNKEVKTEIGFSTVDGKRRLTIKLSPGCHTNTYVYTFKQVIE